MREGEGEREGEREGGREERRERGREGVCGCMDKCVHLPSTSQGQAQGARVFI